jgi:RNA polymerase sigma-70 factor (ECF subfamily)
MGMADPEDHVLVKRVLDGDQSAFTTLVKRHQGVVSRTVHRTLGISLDHEDAVQEVFIRAYNSLHQFDRSRPFVPWIARIAANYCVDQLRRERVRRHNLWTDLEETEQERLLNSLSRKPDFDSMITERPETYEEVAMSLLEELKPRDRMAFLLREVEGLPYRDLAEALNTSELGARIRVSRARKQVQQKFREYLRGTRKGMKKS